MHGHEEERVPLDQIAIAQPPPDDDLLALDKPLTRLTAERPDGAELVELRFVAGLTTDEAAQTRYISPATGIETTRAWLFHAVSDKS